VNPHSILRAGAKLMIPMILLFGLYVQFHGEYSPGGGFQAGIIFAAALVLYSLIFGLKALQAAIPPPVAHGFAAAGALLYMSVGIVSMFMGGQFLEYKVLATSPQTGETIGIILIELGVGITVASVVLTLFYAFAGRSQLRTD
jgi:multicomponent Na+:H+ antiporter subunit B